MTDPKKKVLIVEDYYALAEIEMLLCVMEGYDVQVARDGEAGLDMVDSFNPDLVILDLMLPGSVAGSQVLDRLRSDGRTDPSILVVSALVNPVTAPTLEKFDNVFTMAKPFKVPELAKRVRELLGLPEKDKGAATG
ncbi:MAG: response regulator transcription factor [Candidatus Dormibacteria bacterium]